MSEKKLRNYRNTVSLYFGHCGVNHSLDVPHRGAWDSIIRFLRKRGFRITENQTYKEHYACLSKFHKIGHKGGVALLMEISGAEIKVEFGDIKNLWKGLAQSFWSNPQDDRYTRLTYLEAVAVKLELNKLMAFCARFNLPLAPEKDSLGPEEYIIDNLKINNHIHGKVECLNDIKLSITPESYDWLSNSDDKDKKKIVCGEKKYFYDYRTRRLSCGIVWHNINNMWWVIYGNVLRNVASFELFDYKPSLPRRKPADENYVTRLLKTYESKRDYKKCMGIQKYHENKIAQVA